MECQKCESCGMPMVDGSDFEGKSLQNKYCRYCTYEDGNLKSYDEKVKDFTNFITKSGNVTEASALKMAKEQLRRFPAWEGY